MKKWIPWLVIALIALLSFGIDWTELLSFMVFVFAVWLYDLSSSYKNIKKYLEKLESNSGAQQINLYASGSNKLRQHNYIRDAFDIENIEKDYSKLTKTKKYQFDSIQKTIFDDLSFFGFTYFESKNAIFVKSKDHSNFHILTNKSEADLITSTTLLEYSNAKKEEMKIDFEIVRRRVKLDEIKDLPYFSTVGIFVLTGTIKRRPKYIMSKTDMDVLFDFPELLWNGQLYNLGLTDAKIKEVENTLIKKFNIKIERDSSDPYQDDFGEWGLWYHTKYSVSGFEFHEYF